MKAVRQLSRQVRKPIMKSKLFLSLLGFHLSIACVWAVTYNYTVTVPPGTAGYTLFSDQLLLNPSDLTNTVLGQSLSEGAKFIWWDVPTQTFFTATKGRVPFPYWNLDPTLNVGEGYYCIDPNGATPGPLQVNFVGTGSTTPTKIVNFNPASLYYLLGSQTYDPTPGATYNFLDITGYSDPGMTGVSLYRANTSVLTGSPILSDPASVPSQWDEYWFDGSAWHPSDPQINLGEAVWIGPSQCAIEGTVTDNKGNPLPNWKMSLSDGQYTFTDLKGNYRFAVPSSGGEYTVTQLPPCGWTTLTDPQSITVNCPGPTIVPPFVAIAEPNGPNAGPDLATYVIYVPDPGLPNFPCLYDTGSYYVYYYNKCGATVPAGSTLVVTLSTHVQYGTPGSPSWTQPPGGTATLISGPGTLNWSLGPLPVGVVGLIQIPVEVVSVNPTHPYTTLLQASATVTPVATDAYPSDNTGYNDIYAHCSFDPNDKSVSPAGCGPTGLINSQPLTYTVQFQNVGSAPAFNVVVTDQLDPSLDPSTLKILGASANYVFNLNGNQMTWTFPNIDLPDATDNPQGSHGSFIYQVQPLSGLADGTMITNQASIVFDKNPPVLTAITTNTITSATMPSASFTVTPRPGSADHTNDFTYTGGTVGATFYWDFGPDANPPTSTDMNPSGVVFPANGLRTMNLQVSFGGCDATPASRLLSIGQPVLNIASVAGNQFVLSWQGDGYSLQQANTLSAPVPWQSMSLPLTQVGATYFTPPIAITNVTTFYRLTDNP